MIDGVKIKNLKVNLDERGRLMEILRCDDEIFERFGQVYITTAFPGIVKAWHYHKLQDDNFTCVGGRIKLALYDPRENSPTKDMIEEFVLSFEEPKLIHIPKNVYHGFKNIGDREALVINVVTRPYNRQQPDEYRIDPFKNDIPYDWRSA